MPRANSPGAWAIAWVLAASFADHTARTVPCTASVGWPAITAADRSAAATAPPGSVTSLTSPTAYARAALTRSAVPIRDIRATSPGFHRSFALGPMRRSGSSTAYGEGGCGTSAPRSIPVQKARVPAPAASP